MKCGSIKEKLSSYIDEQLPSEEKLRIEEHVKTCTGCRLVLEDLKRTVAYTQGLPDLEPPPWLSGRVMARVREEAGQGQGILRKLFFPLHIKIPIEVMATIAVVFTAFYIFRTVEPEVKVRSEPVRESMSAVDKSDERPKDIVEKKRKVLEEKKEFQREMYAPEPPPEPVKGLEKEPPSAPALSERQRPVDSFNQKASPGRSNSGTGRFGDEGYRDTFEADAPAPPVMKISVYVSVGGTAVNDIVRAIHESGGTVMKTASIGGKYIISARLPSGRMNGLNEKLVMLGNVEGIRSMTEQRARDVFIDMEVITE